MKSSLRKGLLPLMLIVGFILHILPLQAQLVKDIENAIKEDTVKKSVAADIKDSTTTLQKHLHRKTVCCKNTNYSKPTNTWK